jgi:Mitochondrial carrier protein
MVSSRVPWNTFAYVSKFASHTISLPNQNVGLQTQPDKNRIYNGPFDAIKKIFSQHGIAGIYKGQGVTFLREAMGYGVYFLAYEKLIQREMKQKGIPRNEIKPVNAVLYGAAAGYAVFLFLMLIITLNHTLFQLWAVIYPIDMIKSRMQTDGFTPSTGQKYTSAVDAFRKVLKTEGIGAFTRGLGPTLIRLVVSKHLFCWRMLMCSDHHLPMEQHFSGLRWPIGFLAHCEHFTKHI